MSVHFQLFSLSVFSLYNFYLLFGNYREQPDIFYFLPVNLNRFSFRQLRIIPSAACLALYFFLYPPFQSAKLLLQRSTALKYYVSYRVYSNPSRFFNKLNPFTVFAQINSLRYPICCMGYRLKVSGINENIATEGKPLLSDIAPAPLRT